MSAVERPPVRRRNRTQFMFAFGKRDVDTALPLADAFEKKLQCGGGLARARRTFDEIETAAREPPSEHVIQPGNTGCGAVDGGCARGVVPRLAVKLSVHLCCPVAAYFGSNGDNLARTVPVIR